MIQGLALAGAVGVGGLGTALLRKRPRVAVVPHGDDLPSASLTVNRPPIVSRRDWGALPVNHAARNEQGFYERGRNPEGWYVYEGSLRDSYQTLIIHHSSFYEADGMATLLEGAAFAPRRPNVGRHWLSLHGRCGWHGLRRARVVGPRRAYDGA